MSSRSTSTPAGGADASTFQPMNINFGLFPPLDQRVKKNERKRAMALRALAALDEWGRTAAAGRVLETATG